MQTYDVRYMARRVGAIGVFGEVQVLIEGSSTGDARERAFLYLHANGYETNYCIRVGLPETVEA